MNNCAVLAAMPPAMFGAFGDVTSIVALTPDVGVPPVQLAPFAQSLDVAPVQSVARAGDDAPISASPVAPSNAALGIDTEICLITMPPQRKRPAVADRQAESNFIIVY